jgi:WxL domain surface cell wall-binding
MKLSKIAAVSVLGLSTFVLSSHSTFAATESSGSSKTTVSFTPGTSIINPVDPTDPTKPLNPPGPTDPTDPPTGNAGPLSLDYVSSVAFGSKEISNKSEVYTSTSKKPFIQVSDLRGTGAGWTVTAKASKFTDGTADTLPGAVLTFKDGDFTSTSTSTAPTVEQSIVLNADGSTSSKVFSAIPGAGLGTWVARWLGPNPNVDDGALNDKVTLTIPVGSATVGNHEATVTWTLTDAPGL